MKIEDFIHGVFFAAAIQGIVLFLVFLRRSQKGQFTELLLSLLFLSFSLVLLHWVAFWQGLYEGPLFRIGAVLSTLDFLVCPLIFFFTTSLRETDFRLKKHDWKHFFPFVFFFLAAVVSSFIIKAPPSTSFMAWYRPIYLVAESMQYVLYSAWLITQLAKTDARWLRGVCLLFLTYFGGRMTYVILAQLSIITPMIDYALSVVICSSIFSLAYLNQLRPITLRKKKSYAKSSLSKDHEPIISQEIIDHLVQQKRFLDNDYSIDTLSRELSIPRHHISQALNQHLGKSFSTLINELRIEESIQILKDPKRNKEKILGVAIASGFNNKVSFNKYFKERTGVSPLEFRKKFVAEK